MFQKLLVDAYVEIMRMLEFETRGILLQIVFSVCPTSAYSGRNDNNLKYFEF